MTDLSPYLAWPCVVLGVVASFRLGRGRSGPLSFGRVVGAFFGAMALGLALSMATSALHTVCIESLHWCVSRGDRNIGYWFHALLAFPLYWLLMLVPARRPPRPRSPPR